MDNNYRNFKAIEALKAEVEPWAWEVLTDDTGTWEGDPSVAGVYGWRNNDSGAIEFILYANAPSGLDFEYTESFEDLQDNR